MKDQVTERALKIAKDKFGWNQRQFAERIGVEKQHVTMWLTRGMPAGRHAKAASELQISIEELLTGEASNQAPDFKGAGWVAEAKATYHGYQVSPEGARFAAEWEKLRSPLKAQIQALVETLVAEQKRDERDEPKVRIKAEKRHSA